MTICLHLGQSRCLKCAKVEHESGWKGLSRDLEVRGARCKAALTRLDFTERAKFRASFSRTDGGLSDLHGILLRGNLRRPSKMGNGMYGAFHKFRIS